MWSCHCPETCITTFCSPPSSESAPLCSPATAARPFRPRPRAIDESGVNERSRLLAEGQPSDLFRCKGDAGVLGPALADGGQTGSRESSRRGRHGNRTIFAAGVPHARRRLWAREQGQSDGGGRLSRNRRGFRRRLGEASKIE